MAQAFPVLDMQSLCERWEGRHETCGGGVDSNPAWTRPFAGGEATVPPHPTPTSNHTTLTPGQRVANDRPA